MPEPLIYSVHRCQFIELPLISVISGFNSSFLELPLPWDSSSPWAKGCQVGHQRVTLAFPITRKNVLLSGRTRATQESKSSFIFCLSIFGNCSTASSYYCAILCHLSFQLNKGFLWMQVTHFWKVASRIFTYFNPESQRKLYTNN